MNGGEKGKKGEREKGVDFFSFGRKRVREWVTSSFLLMTTTISSSSSYWIAKDYDWLSGKRRGTDQDGC